LREFPELFTVSRKEFISFELHYEKSAAPHPDSQRGKGRQVVGRRKPHIQLTKK
jgi:hypothetical protein